MENIEKDIMNRIDNLRDEIIKFHQQLIQMPSEVPPGKYRKISKFVAEKMNELGMTTKIKRNNVLAELGTGKGPSLIFNAHFDTVPVFDGWTKDPLGGELIENKIYGRGAADDKACVAAEIFAAKALIDAGIDLKGKLIITAVVNEEIGGLGGTKYLVNEEIVKGDACLLGDVPSDYPIAYTDGAFQIGFDITGIRRHFMYPDLSPPHRNKYSGINAIHKMLKIMNFLMELQEDFKKEETKYPYHPDLPSKISSVTFSKIEGGTSLTAIPDKCFLRCFISLIPEHDAESIKTKILNFIEELKKEDPDLDILVQIPVTIEPQIADINSDFAKIVKKSFKIVYGEEREFKLFMATDDAHLFQNKGINTISIGPFRGENNIHAQDEFVYVEDLINTTKLFAITALNYLK